MKYPGFLSCYLCFIVGLIFFIIQPNIIGGVLVGFTGGLSLASLALTALGVLE